MQNKRNKQTNKDKTKNNKECSNFPKPGEIPLFNEAIMISAMVWARLYCVQVLFVNDFSVLNVDFDSIQILTALRGTVKIIGPRWCQNHDYARSKVEGIVMVLTSPRAYNLTVPRIKSSQYLFYIPNEKIAKFEGIVHFDRLLPN